MVLDHQHWENSNSGKVENRNTTPQMQKTNKQANKQTNKQKSPRGLTTRRYTDTQQRRGLKVSFSCFYPWQG